MESQNKVKTRPITITAASLAFIIFGIVTIVVSVILGIALSSLGSISGVQAIVIAVILFFVLAIAVLDIVAGYGLWHMQRWASIMGMLLGVFGLLAQNFTYLVYGIAAYSYYGYGALGSGSPYVNVILIILIAISWKSFEPSTA